MFLSFQNFHFYFSISLLHQQIAKGVDSSGCLLHFSSLVCFFLYLFFLGFHGVVSFFLVFTKVLLFLHLVYDFCVIVSLFCVLHVIVARKFVPFNCVYSVWIIFLLFLQLYYWLYTSQAPLVSSALLKSWFLWSFKFCFLSLSEKLTFLHSKPYKVWSFRFHRF